MTYNWTWVSSGKFNFREFKSVYIVYVRNIRSAKKYYLLTENCVNIREKHDHFKWWNAISHGSLIREFSFLCIWKCIFYFLKILGWLKNCFINWKLRQHTREVRSFWMMKFNWIWGCNSRILILMHLEMYILFLRNIKLPTKLFY